jgi:hypothetical protein
MTRHWTEQEKRYVAQHYPAIGAKKLTELVSNRTEKAIFRMAQHIGVKKSHDRLREVGRENVGRRKDRQSPPFAEPPEVST